MDEPYEKHPGWLEWGIVVALVIIIVICAFVLLGGPQISSIFTNVGNTV